MYMQFYWLQKQRLFPLDTFSTHFLPKIINYADSVANRATGSTPAFGISDWGRVLFNRSVRQTG